MDRRNCHRKLSLSKITALLLLTLLTTCEKPVRVLKFDTTEASPTDISFTTATLKGQITDLGSAEVEQHGILVSESSVPNIGQQTTIEKTLGKATSKGYFSAEFTGLKVNFTYYFRAFAVVDGEPHLGSIKQFTTKDYVLPVVTIASIPSVFISKTQAFFSAEVTSAGGDVNSIRGLCWGNSENPTIETCVDTTVNGTGEGEFNGWIEGLNPGERYYARAYATNLLGTAYSSADAIFKTHDLPEVTTTSVSGITTSGAVSGGEVIDDGEVEVTTRGVCWSTTTGPTVDLLTKTSDGTGKGTFVSNITGLSPGVTYYVRAYATNLYGTSYGQEHSFTTTSTAMAPTAVTSPATQAGTSTATLNGSVNANNQSTVVSFEYGTSTSYGSTVAAIQSPVSGNTPVNVTAGISGLVPGTTYHYRIKAVNSGGTSYGEDVTFITSSISQATVSTTSVTSVTSSSATSGGSITSDGGSTITAKGVCWSTAANPTISDQKTTDGTGTASFTSSITGLAPATTYHVRAYATNSAGTAYGSDLTFTSSAPLPTVNDFDGNSYNIVTIGTQEWIQRNLLVTHYSNGDVIPNITDNTSWGGLSTGAYAWYNNDAGNNKETYGALYNWYVADDIRNVCPAGWHVPTDADWTVLSAYLGGESVSGGKLKEAGLIHWASPNTGATNETGFTALPAGERESDGNNFSALTYSNFLWSSTSWDGGNSWTRFIPHNDGYIFRSYYNNRYGYSIRCLKGAIPLAETVAASAISFTTTTLNGEVNPNSLSTTVTFEYGTSTSYGTSVTASQSPATGSIPVNVSYNLSGLTPNTTYHYRVKAVNSDGTAYGSDMTFTTPESISGTFIDIRDNKEYSWVKIGTQNWMAENLAYLPTVFPPTTESTTNNIYYVLNYNGTNTTSAKATMEYSLYGVLYNWSAALSSCPTGWHLPDNDEWETLAQFISTDNGGYGKDGDDWQSVGGNLKSTTGWLEPGNGTNDYGFNAFPGGEREATNIFELEGTYCRFWSSDINPLDTQEAINRYMNNTSSRFYQNNYYIGKGFSVRCLKD